MTKIKYMLCAIIIAFALNSCSDDENSVFETRKVERNNISYTAGFTWFDAKVMGYDVTPSIIDEIKPLYNKDKHKFLFIDAPACFCDSAQNIFPYTTRILEEIPIDTSSFIFYAVNDKDAEHPYKQLVNIETFPCIYLMVDGEIKYHISDTLTKARNGRLIEEIVLESLKNNQ